MAGADVVEVEMQLAGSPAEVYRYWTSPDWYRRWMGALVRLDPVPGGEYFVQMNCALSTTICRSRHCATPI